MTNLFLRVKASITTRQAAEAYGLSVASNGMTCCPFHNDHHPSMKVDTRYYCFACHETGDVIDFTAKLFKLRPYEAAKKLAADFGIDPNTPVAMQAAVFSHSRTTERQSVERCVAVLVDYEQLLRHWMNSYAPATPNEPVHPRFEQAAKELPSIGHLVDCLYQPDLREQTAKALLQGKALVRLEAALQQAREEVQHEPTVTAEVYHATDQYKESPSVSAA